MDTRTGKLIEEQDIPEGQKEHFVPVMRDLTKQEQNNAQIKLYAPCACGSGKKLKFCCYRKS